MVITGGHGISSGCASPSAPACPPFASWRNLPVTTSSCWPGVSSSRHGACCSPPPHACSGGCRWAACGAPVYSVKGGPGSCPLVQLPDLFRKTTYPPGSLPKIRLDTANLTADTLLAHIGFNPDTRPDRLQARGAALIKNGTKQVQVGWGGLGRSEQRCRGGSVGVCTQHTHTGCVHTFHHPQHAACPLRVKGCWKPGQFGSWSVLKH